MLFREEVDQIGKLQRRDPCLVSLNRDEDLVIVQLVPMRHSVGGRVANAVLSIVVVQGFDFVRLQFASINHSPSLYSW